MRAGLARAGIGGCCGGWRAIWNEDPDSQAVIESDATPHQLGLTGLWLTGGSDGASFPHTPF